MKKDLSKVRVLGLTLLVTMSSCVIAPSDLRAETFRFLYNLELYSELTSTSSQNKADKQKTIGAKNRFSKIIETGRISIQHQSISVFCTVLFSEIENYCCTSVNKKISEGIIICSNAYTGQNQHFRAGPALA